MSKIVVLAVGPCVRPYILPEIERAWMESEEERKVILQVRRTVRCSMETRGLTLEMKSLPTRLLAMKLRMGIARKFFESPDVLIGDAHRWWPSQGDRRKPDL